MGSTWFAVVAALVFAIPVVAVIGGITAGIFKTRGQQRLIELAQRERIAAIEKGIDPAKLPPLPAISDEGAKALTEAFRSEMGLSPRQRGLRDARGFLVAGVITLSCGVGLSLMLVLLPGAARASWPVGLLPGIVGVGLLVASALVRRDVPADDGGEHGPNA